MNTSTCSSESSPTSTTHTYNAGRGYWEDGVDYPFPVYAGTPLLGPDFFYFWTLGGITSDAGDETAEVVQMHIEGRPDFQELGPNSYGTRSYALAIEVDNVCPGA